MANTRNLIERRRSKQPYKSPLDEIETGDSDEKHFQNSVSWWWPFCFIILGAVLYYFVYAQDQALPKPVTIADARQNPNLFCAERSRNFVKRLTRLGSRVFGDDSNEIHAPKLIEDEIEDIIKYAPKVQSILLQRQKGNGSYFLEFSPPFFNVYNAAQNVIAMLEGSEGSHSILINCHYDTVPFSYGGSDDAISCSSMLEILRIMSIAPVRPKHNIVFLFNGAEETPLQAAHLFLQHEWAEKCRVVVNLEAAGAGGRLVLFQSGPENPWLFKYYAQNVPHPHGQIVGEDFFQKGLIPSDTDFRIFRDFKNMRGLDFAFWRSGYAYHTSFDADNLIPIGSYQHMGDDILALVKALADAEEINDMQKHSQGQMVYYDYLGWFMIYYSSSTNIVLNMMAILLSIASIMIFIGRPSRWRHIRELIHRIFSRFLGMVASIIFTVILGMLVDIVAPLAMPWYANPLLIFPLYWCPCLAIYMLIPHLLESRWSKQFKMPLLSTTHMNLIASQVPWTFLLFALTAVGSRSSMVFFPIVLSSAVANLIIHLTSLKQTAFKWIWVYLAVHIPALLYNMYLMLMAYMFFIPIMGRAGPVNGDLIISLISSLAVLFMFSFAMPLMGLVNKIKRTLFTLLILSAVTILLLKYIGHPYSSSPSDPRPQRYLIFHTHRLFKDQFQRNRLNDNGYVIYNMDRNSPYTVPIEKDQILSVLEDCENELYCGIPMLTARTINISPKCSWIGADAPYLRIDTEAILKKEEPRCDSATNTCRLSLTLKGPNRLTFTVVPYEGTSLLKWSLDSEIKQSGDWKGRPIYFFHITSGTPEIEFSITLTFSASQGHFLGNPLAEVTLSGHYIHEKNIRTKQFQEFLDSFPEWTHQTAWQSAHRSYIF